VDDAFNQEVIEEEASGSNRDRPVLRMLPNDKRPVQKTACETCVWANWYTTDRGLHAYCRRMYLITWPAKPGEAITSCDGELEPPEK